MNGIKLLQEINEDNPIILICRSGKRSKMITNMIDKEFRVIICTQTGINSWINKKLM